METLQQHGQFIKVPGVFPLIKVFISFNDLSNEDKVNKIITKHQNYYIKRKLDLKNKNYEF